MGRKPEPKPLDSVSAGVATAVGLIALFSAYTAFDDVRAGQRALEAGLQGSQSAIKDLKDDMKEFKVEIRADLKEFQAKVDTNDSQFRADLKELQAKADMNLKEFQAKADMRDSQMLLGVLIIGSVVTVGVVARRP